MTARYRPPTRHGLTRPGPNEHRPTPATATPAPRRHPTPDTSDMRGPLLYTAEQAATLLQVRPSWLRRKAAARAIPCRFLGKHLRFSRADIDAIADASAQPPTQQRHTRSID